MLYAGAAAVPDESWSKSPDRPQAGRFPPGGRKPGMDLSKVGGKRQSRL